MMKNCLLLIFSMFVCFYPVLIEGINQDGDCPKPIVQKQTIIRSKESISNGATLIGKEVVSSAHDCYNLCCTYDNCNTAVMHYKKSIDALGEEQIQKFCYLFACGAPTVCIFDDHPRYAIIQLGVPTVPVTKTSTTTTTNAPSTIKSIPPATSEQEVERCPPGVPTAMCSDDPCVIKSCASHPEATCKANYCGGCSAVFYNKDGTKTVCNNKKGNTADNESTITKDNHNEQVLTVDQIDYGETPADSLPAPISHIKEKTARKSDEDPYYQSDKRKWLDTNTEPTVTTQITKVKVKIVQNPLMSIPLLVALIICVILLIGLIYRFKCARKGKPKKFPVDDGDYLINGMYL